MPTPWKTEARRTVIADRWIDVRAERVVTGKGAVLDPYYIVHYPDWAVCVALTEDDRLVMVRQYRHGTGRAALELPGGMVDAGESGEAAGPRELLEETGHGGGDIRSLGRFAANPAIQTNYLHVTLMTGARPVAAPKEEAGEEVEIVLLPFAEALAAALDGRMEQSMHVAALLAAAVALGRLAPR